MRRPSGGRLGYCTANVARRLPGTRGKSFTFAVMARPTPASAASRRRPRGLAFRWQRVGVLAAVALALSLGLVLYLFGWDDDFASRLFTTFSVSFVLLAVTFLGIIPFIGWATAHWFGPGWATGVDGAPKRRPAAAPARSTTTRATSSTTTT